MEQSPAAVSSSSFTSAYVPLHEFRAVMENIPPSPYQPKFSIIKLIEELKSRNARLRGGELEETIRDLERLEKQIEQASENWESLLQQEDCELLKHHIFPSFFFKGQMGFIKAPFENHNFRFVTDALHALQSSERWAVKVDPRNFLKNKRQHLLMAGITVLNTFYDQEVDFFSGEGMVLRDQSSKMERHYKFNIQLDYLEVKALKPLKKLSQKQIYHLLNNLDDEALWLECIPPENFLFKGFLIGMIADATKPEILSILKEMAANEGGKSGHENDLNEIELMARSFLNMPEIRFGVLQTASGPWVESVFWCLLRRYDKPAIHQSLEDSNSPYGRVLHQKEPVVVEDLKKEKSASALEEALLHDGIRSLLLVPLTDDEGQVISIFELGAPVPYQFTQLTLHQLRDFIALIEMGANKFIQEMENSVRLTIQQEFTSIHPSVEWRFRNVASKYFWEREVEQRQTSPEPIVFKDVYPIYGQADIVGSSRQRNTAIQADLTDNLKRVYAILKKCRECVHFHLLDIYAEKVEAFLEKLAKDGIISSDESVIVELLTQQIHPMLRKLRNRFPELPQALLDEYFVYLDPELDIVYRSRKAYEESVSRINQAVSHYLLQEEEKMQEVLPHYFEKFQTDGVEYNLYLGQSLLEEMPFHSFYLHDFRLWQLILMCEITRLVERQAETLPVPLTTAQLIFVFNSTLSIRFQMDEKQFDVDGAYNVRYEILKKRIDKAYIKGTDERLTQAGKVAIVWLQEKDRQEYQEYLDHLVRNGYIQPEIEDLELERMQGVEGLKAIRVTVI
jgi:hypothetical protein